jgi:hypothetical protein
VYFCADCSGNAKPQATSITGGPHWLQHEITEDAKDEALETSVKGALEAIAQGKTFDEWAKTTKMSPEVKAEVRKRLAGEDAGEDEGEDEESHGAHHQKDHITKAVFDSLPPEEQEKHQDSLRNAMNSHGLGDDEEEEQPQEEPEEQPQEEPAPEKAPGDGLDYEIEDEKEKEEPKMKLSKKKEKVTINPKMEQKEYTKKLISELKEKRKNRIDEKAPPGREDQVKSLKKKVGKDGAYAIAWAQHNKHGRPDNNEEVEIEENLSPFFSLFEITKV